MTALQILVFNDFQPQMIVLFVAIVVLLLITALVSGAETAFFSLSPSDINSIQKRHGKSDKAILRLLSDQDYMLASMLIVNDLMNISIVLLSNQLIDLIVTFPEGAATEFVTKTIVVTFILLLFGEMMPKIFAASHPLRFARFMAMPMLGLKHFMKPFSYLLVGSGGRLKSRLARKKGNISRDQLSDAIEITPTHSEEERQMLSGIVSFVNTEVAEIMRLRIDMVSLDMAADFEQVKQVIISSGVSRIPVYKESVDNIKGVLYVKDMLPFIAEGPKFAWQSYLRPPYFVPDHKKINDLMAEFQANKVHLAVVVDEYGCTQGLVTLEDILEEIVGEITDESDVEVPTFYRKIDDSHYIFDGKTHLSDLEKVLGFEEDHFHDVKRGAETVAGLMLELKRDFLKKGDAVSSHGVKFVVDSLEGRRIDKVAVEVIN